MTKKSAFISVITACCMTVSCVFAQGALCEQAGSVSAENIGAGGRPSTGAGQSGSGTVVRPRSEYDIIYDSGTKTISISVKTDRVKTLASVEVVPYGKKRADITASDMESAGYVFRTVRSGEDGNIEMKLTMPDTAPGNMYTVYVDCDGYGVSDSFSYINDAELADIVSKQINPAGSADAIVQIIKNNASALGLDSASADSYCAVIGDGIYFSKPNGGYSTEKFKNTFRQLTAIAKIKSGEAADLVMKAYSADFGLLYADYISASENAKYGFSQKIQSCDVKTLLPDVIFSESFYTSVLNTSENYVMLKNNSHKFAYITKLDLSYARGDYNYVNSAYSDIYGTAFTSISDFDTQLHEKIDYYKNYSQSGGSGVGASSGGTSPKGGSSFAADSSSVNTGAVSYSDTGTHWARDMISELSKRNIVSGYADGSFRPDNNVTRAEFSKLLVAMSGNAMTYNRMFDDVTESDWFYPYVSSAADMKLVNGYNGRFEPNGLITRQDAAVMIYRYAVSKGYELTGSKKFADSDEIASYAEQSVGALAANSVVDGSDGMFRPMGNTTRAEAAALIYKLISFMKEL